MEKDYKAMDVRSVLNLKSRDTKSPTENIL